MPTADRAKHDLIHLQAAEVTPGLDPEEKARIFHAAETAANHIFHDQASAARRLNQPDFGSLGFHAALPQSEEESSPALLADQIGQDHKPKGAPAAERQSPIEPVTDDYRRVRCRQTGEIFRFASQREADSHRAKFIGRLDHEWPGGVEGTAVLNEIECFADTPWQLFKGSEDAKRFYRAFIKSNRRGTYTLGQRENP